MKYIVLFLMLALTLAAEENASAPPKYVVRAEDGLKELIKDDIQKIQTRSKGIYTLVSKQENSREILILSAEKEKNALEIHPYLRHGVVFLIHPKNPCTTISKADAENILKNKLHAWPGTATRLRNVYYLKGMFEQGTVPARTTETRFNSLPFVDLANKLLKQEPEAIVILPLFYLTDPQPETRFLSIDGIAPDFQSVTEGRYPMQKLYYLQRMQDIPEAKVLMRRLLSPEKKRNILKFGAIPVPEETEK